MDMLRDDFRRRKDGSIDYDFYRASAAEFRREERKRVIRAAIAGAFRFMRGSVAAAVPGRFRCTESSPGRRVTGYFRLPQNR